jgi:hypothetical protein
MGALTGAKAAGGTTGASATGEALGGATGAVGAGELSFRLSQGRYFYSCHGPIVFTGFGRNGYSHHLTHDFSSSFGSCASSGRFAD